MCISFGVKLQKEMANIFGIRIPSIKQQRCQLPLKGKELCFGMKIIKNTLMQSLRGGLILTDIQLHIADAIYKQLTTLEHVLFGGLHTSLQLSSRS
jgi:hypothetical protein